MEAKVNAKDVLQTSGELFEKTPEENVVLIAQQGDKDALLYILTKHKRTVRLIARRYFLVGADYEDLVQEGMIGLYEAVCDYRPEYQTSFASFSELCVKRQMISAIQSATRQKHTPLNNYVSFNRPIFGDNQDQTLQDTIQAKAGDPEQMLIDQENLVRMENHIRNALSPLEKAVLNLFMEGKSYQEISYQLNKDNKAVDNALQRIKKKINRYLSETQNSDGL